MSEDWSKIALSHEPGWSGVFTRHQAEGAYPNGSRVVKARLGRFDKHQIGDRATVLGSYALPNPVLILGMWHKIGYWVEWDDMPKRAVFITDAKIQLEQ